MRAIDRVGFASLAVRRPRHRRLGRQVRARRADRGAGRAGSLRLVRRRRATSRTRRSARSASRSAAARSGTRPSPASRSRRSCPPSRGRASGRRSTRTACRRPADRRARPGRAPRDWDPSLTQTRTDLLSGNVTRSGQEHRGGPLVAPASSTRSTVPTLCCRDATTSSSTWTRRPRRRSSSPGRSVSTSAISAIRRPRTRRPSSRTTSATPSSGSTTTSSKPNAARPTAKSCSPTIPGTGRTTLYKKLPKTTTASVNLPGRRSSRAARLRDSLGAPDRRAARDVRRRLRSPSAIRRAKNWTRPRGHGLGQGTRATSVTEGAAPIKPRRAS